MKTDPHSIKPQTVVCEEITKKHSVLEDRIIQQNKTDTIEKLTARCIRSEDPIIEILSSKYEEIKRKNSSLPLKDRIFPTPPTTDQTLSIEEIASSNMGEITQDRVVRDYAGWLTETRDFVIENPSNAQRLSEALYPGDEQIENRIKFMNTIKVIIK